MNSFLVGANWFGVKRRFDELTQAFIAAHGDLAVERIVAPEATKNEITGALESLPFLASKKLVILQDLSQNSEVSEQLEKIVELAGDTTDLIIIEGKLDKRSAYYKQLKKLPGFEEFNELDENALTGWAVERAMAEGAKISTSDARYLIQRVGANQALVANELWKLAQYDPNITRQTIDLVTEETPASTVFNLIDTAFSGNLAGAIKVYDEQRAQKVEPQAIHGMLVWQMHLVTLCLAAGEVNSRDLAAEVRQSPFVIQKSQAIARRMGREKVEQFLETLRDIDYTSKKQTYDYDEAMRYAITLLAQ